MHPGHAHRSDQPALAWVAATSACCRASRNWYDVTSAAAIADDVREAPAHRHELQQVGLEEPIHFGDRGARHEDHVIWSQPHVGGGVLAPHYRVEACGEEF